MVQRPPLPNKSAGAPAPVAAKQSPINDNIVRNREDFVFLRQLFGQPVTDTKDNVLEQYMNASIIHGTVTPTESDHQITVDDRFEIIRIWKRSGNFIYKDEKERTFAVSHEGDIIPEDVKIYDDTGKLNKELVKGFMRAKIETESIYDYVPNIGAFLYTFQTMTPLKPPVSAKQPSSPAKADSDVPTEEPVDDADSVDATPAEGDATQDPK